MEPESPDPDDPATDPNAVAGASHSHSHRRVNVRFRRPRPNWPLRIILGGLIAVWAVWSLLPRDHSGWQTAPGLLANAATGTIEFAVGLWFFVTGAAIGSFLNVLAARWPRGEGFVSANSHCPRCERRLLRRDNVPILGWVWLRGRCRWCRLPIAPRYWIVEAVTGGCFLWFALVELLSGGASLPGWKPGSPAGVMWIILWPRWDLIALYAWHMGMFSLLIATALIRMDRLRLPAGMWAVALVLLCLPALGGLAGKFLHQSALTDRTSPALAAGAIHPVTWWQPFSGARPPGRDPDAVMADSLWTVLAGIGGGIAAALLLFRLAAAAERSSRSATEEGARPERPAGLWWPWCLAWTVIGGVCGWQAAAATGLLFVVAAAAWRWSPVLGRTGAVACLGTALFVHHSVWRWAWWFVFARWI